MTTNWLSGFRRREHSRKHHQASVTAGDAAGLRHEHGRLDALTGIRAFAALWVVLYHFYPNVLVLFPSISPSAPIIRSGYLGVDLFFTLSGFILAYNYVHRLGTHPSLSNYVRFLWLRFARIWPVHFFTLNVVVILFAGASFLGIKRHDGLRSGLGAYIENITMTHVWWGGGGSFNGAAWSISAEWFAYVLFPFAAIGLVRLRGLWIAWLGVILCYCALEGRFVFLLQHDVGTTDGVLSRVALEFLAGCFLFRVWEQSQDRRRWGIGTAVAVALIVAGVWLINDPNPPSRHGLVMAPLFGLLVLSIASAPQSLSARYLAWPRVVFWGEVSYSMYMTHFIVYMVVTKALRPGRIADASIIAKCGLIAVYALLVGAAAVGTYLIVERPSRDRLRSVSFSSLVGRPARAD